MQTNVVKLFAPILAFFVFIPYLTHCQVNEKSLFEADSLFEDKKYTESFIIYEKFIKEARLYSPDMLLKMAFIQEGSGNQAQALYYLSLYDHYKADERAVKKMAEIAEKEELKGYGYTDAEYFGLLYRKNQNALTLSAAFLALAGIAFLLYLKKTGKRAAGPSLLVVAACLLLFALINADPENRFGIISQSDCYVMSAPSAGAEVVSIEKAGHKVPIKGDSDVWYEIEWEGRQAFVRKANILPIL